MKRSERFATGKTPKEIQQRLANAKGQLQKSFAAAFCDAVAKYKGLVQEKKKGQLSFCYISFLRSSVILKRPFFSLDLYDENERMDLTECGTLWSVSAVSNFIYSDIPMEISPVPASDDLNEWEIEALWIAEAEKYYEQMQPMLNEIVFPLRSEFPSLEFYYGEYMDKANRI